MQAGQVKKKTVKKHIFQLNAWMVAVMLIALLLINALFIKIYSESIEHEVKNYLEYMKDTDDLKKVVENFTIYNSKFILLFLADAMLCVGAFVAVSGFFTKKLADYIMTPLDSLTAGAKRIRENDLTQDIDYTGDAEFEDVCHSFNEMRMSILTEQEKNRKYEKARTEMIAGISHDLRTPLTAVRGTIKGLLDGVASTEVQRDKFLQTAYRRTGDMDRLLNQLFYLSKLETGNMPIYPKEISLPDFIIKYVNGKREILGEEDIHISADVQEMEENVSVDPEQLARIFDNLFENSRKYAHVQHLEIQIDLEKTEQGALVRFSDNGMGVPEEQLSHLFEEFYRGDESRNQKDGNGLGLYIVKYLIEAMGGSVRAENDQGLCINMEFKSSECQGKEKL